MSARIGDARNIPKPSFTSEIPSIELQAEPSLFKLLVVNVSGLSRQRRHFWATFRRDRSDSLSQSAVTRRSVSGFPPNSDMRASFRGDRSESEVHAYHDLGDFMVDHTMEDNSISTNNVRS